MIFLSFFVLLFGNIYQIPLELLEKHLVEQKLAAFVEELKRIDPDLRTEYARVLQPAKKGAKLNQAADPKQTKAAYPKEAKAVDSEETKAPDPKLTMQGLARFTWNTVFEANVC